jgi:hypothetical protein
MGPGQREGPSPYEHQKGILFASLSVTMRSFKRCGCSILYTKEKALIPHSTGEVLLALVLDDDTAMARLVAEKRGDQA